MASHPLSMLTHIQPSPSPPHLVAEHGFPRIAAAIVAHHREARRPRLQLSLPVGQHRGWRGNQEGAGGLAGLHQVGKQGDDLGYGRDGEGGGGAWWSVGSPPGGQAGRWPGGGEGWGKGVGGGQGGLWGLHLVGKQSDALGEGRGGERWVW